MNMENSKWQMAKDKQFLLRGFTIAELLVTIAIFATLVGIATSNLVGGKQRASLNASGDIFTGDFRQQQLKAMIGDTEGRSAPDTYGVHFGSSEYTLFHGSTFNIMDSSNFTVMLGDNISFVSPPPNLVFARVSGELPSGGSIVMIDNTTKSTITLQFNRYGVITSID